MNLVADENIDRGIVERLRADGHCSPGSMSGPGDGNCPPTELEDILEPDTLAA